MLKNKWFTIVEVIVSVAILAILATISFFAFNTYVSWSRDSKRIVDVESISNALEVYAKKNWASYPKPSDFILLSYSWETANLPFAYLWFVKNNLELSFNTVPSDPITADFYPYWITIDKKTYQIACTLENPPSDTVWLDFTTNKAYAWAEYSYVIWNYKKNESKWYYADSIILLESSWGLAWIPKTDTVIWSLSGTTFTTWTWIIYVLNKWTQIPYPIFSKDNFKSVSKIEWSWGFVIETTGTWMSIDCPTCE